MIELLASVIIVALGVTGSFLGYLLRKSRTKIKRLEGVRDQCKKLTRMNDILTSGASIKLTLYERNMIRMALEYTPFRDMMRLPQTKKFIRDTWRALRVKIRESIKQ